MSGWIYDPKEGRCRKTDGEQAVSDDKIAEIRARHEAGPLGQMPAEDRMSSHLRWRWLLGEVDRRGAEIEKQRAEIERLRAEIDGLEAELALMKSGFEIAYRAMGGKP